MPGEQAVAFEGEQGFTPPKRGVRLALKGASSQAVGDLIPFRCERVELQQAKGRMLHLRRDPPG
jgi:hypothetical protein